MDDSYSGRAALPRDCSFADVLSDHRRIENALERIRVLGLFHELQVHKTLRLRDRLTTDKPAFTGVEQRGCSGRCGFGSALPPILPIGVACSMATKPPSAIAAVTYIILFNLASPLWDCDSSMADPVPEPMQRPLHTRSKRQITVPRIIRRAISCASECVRRSPRPTTPAGDVDFAYRGAATSATPPALRVPKRTRRACS